MKRLFKHLKVHHKANHQQHELMHTSFSKANLIVFILIFAAIGGYAIYRSLAAVPGTTANLWVDTDGGSCTRSATPAAYDTATACASFNAAYAAAQAGDQVIIKGGTYPNNQVINWRADHHDYTSRVVFSVAAGETVKVTGIGTSGEVGYGRGLYIMAEHLEIHGTGAGISSGGGDGNLVFADTSNNYTSVNLTYVNSSGASNDCMGTGLDQHANDIIIDGIRARSILTSCASNATIENSTFGCTGDPQLGINTCNQNIFGDGPRAGSNVNLKVIGNVFRDVLIGTDGQHTGCIFVEGATDSLISGNWLQSCAVNNIQYKPTGAGIFAGTQTIENNWETRQCGSGSPCGSAGDDNGVLNNLYNAKYVIRFNTSEGTCNFIDTGSTYQPGTQVYGNLCTSYTGTSMPCGLANVTYGYNVWPTSGSKCDPTDVLADVPVVHAVNFDGPLNNFHLTAAASAAKDLVPATFLSGCPATDFDGDSRPQGSACDAGADEYVPSATVWVSTAGDDNTCVRGDQTKPCASFTKAYQIAQCADVVVVENGTYATQSVGPDLGIHTDCSSPIIIEGQSKAGVVINGSIKINVPWLTIKTMTVGTSGTGSAAMVNFDDIGTCNTTSTSHVAFDDLIAGTLTIDNVQYATVSNSSFGNVTSTESEIHNRDPLPCQQDDHISLLNNTWHDYYNVDGGNTHMECLQIDAGASGGTNSNITIAGNRFQNCGQYDLFTTGNQTNFQIYNNYFDKPCSNQTIGNPVGCAALALVSMTLGGSDPSTYNFTGIVVKFNTFNGAFQFGTDTTTGVNTGNLFEYNISPAMAFDGIHCGSNLKWTHISNYTNGTFTCSGDVKSAVTFVSPNPSDYNFDLAAGSNGIGVLSPCPADAPATDIYGNPRPSSACSVGAYEYTAAAVTPGDLNKDGHVNVLDLSMLLSHWQSTDTTADINASGKVDILDLSILLNHYGT